MIKENDPMIPRKGSNDDEIKMMKQREKEMKGRFVKAGIKTWILVGNHEDAEKRIARFNERINQPLTR
ncbi:hypothetical protein [Phocaeicola plebeius]|mgnify:CR=1 FL=1|uniref:hypothetical protein n=1 Tax=Phocaeicola plebeius TaxID=310297 RepID=UPI004029DE86